MANLPQNAFWDFSVAAYGRAEVAAACVALQDRYGLDVNLLLFCCWAADQGQALGAAQQQRAIGISLGWQNEVVHPLRFVRRRLKQGFRQTPREWSEHARDAIAAAELAAEHVEQQLLAGCLPAGEPAPEPDRPALAAANIAGYGRAAGIGWAVGDTTQLSIVLRGAFPRLAAADAMALAGAVTAGTIAP